MGVAKGSGCKERRCIMAGKLEHGVERWEEVREEEKTVSEKIGRAWRDCI